MCEHNIRIQNTKFLNVELLGKSRVVEVSLLSIKCLFIFLTEYSLKNDKPAFSSIERGRKRVVIIIVFLLQ